MNKSKLANILIVILYILFILYSYYFNFQPGTEIGNIFFKNFIEMIKILPFAFIIIGLFEVWVKKGTIEKHLGEEGGFTGYIWAILLGGATIGPMIVSLPFAYALFNKGARLDIVFTYLGAAAVCRIPMTIFEMSYLGVKFTIIRYLVSIPLVILSSIILAKIINVKKLPHH